MIRFFFENTKPVLKNRNLLKGIIDKIVTDEGFSIGDISVIFCDDDYLLKINRKYLTHNYYTDIITFDHSEENVISGDLFISIDRVKENAHTFGTTYTSELFRVIFHGVLHLVGYEDKNDDLRKVMREKEDYYLIKAGKNEK